MARTRPSLHRTCTSSSSESAASTGTAATAQDSVPLAALAPAGRSERRKWSGSPAKLPANSSTEAAPVACKRTTKSVPTTGRPGTHDISTSGTGVCAAAGSGVSIATRPTVVSAPAALPHQTRRQGRRHSHWLAVKTRPDGNGQSRTPGTPKLTARSMTEVAHRGRPLRGIGGGLGSAASDSAA